LGRKRFSAEQKIKHMRQTGVLTAHFRNVTKYVTKRKHE